MSLASAVAAKVRSDRSRGGSDILLFPSMGLLQTFEKPSYTVRSTQDGLHRSCDAMTPACHWTQAGVPVLVSGSINPDTSSRHIIRHHCDHPGL